MSLRVLFKRLYASFDERLLFIKQVYLDHLLVRYSLLLLLVTIPITFYQVKGFTIIPLIISSLLLFLIIYRRSFREVVLIASLLMASSVTLFYLTSSILTEGKERASRYITSLYGNDSFVVDILNPIKLKASENVVWGRLNDGSKVYLKTPSYPVVHPGERCEVFGSVERVDGSSGFGEYLTSHRTFLSGKVYEITCYSLWSQALYTISTFKFSVISQLEKVINEPYASLVIGIMFGEDRVYTSDFEEGVRVSGLSHVVAASGFNVNFIVTVISTCLFFIPRQLRFILMLTLLSIYTVLCGNGASIMRAVLMWSVGESFNLAGISLPTIQYLLLSAVLMVLLNPFIFLDIGFQLSFMATLGIVILTKVYSDRFSLPENLVTSVICTLFTAPVIAKSFESISLWGILSNLILLNSIELVMGFGFIFIILSLFLAQSTLYYLSVLFEFMLSPMIFIVEISTKLGLGGINMGYILPTIVMMCTFGLGISLLHTNYTKRLTGWGK
ncbi:MAG TPA: ComEC/Rec2 family competence protein [Candidatus Dojkabacteria bacterium]|nr:ComEC/Rec2 family competence protein [Candidatus Dojkabacteria bacterium]